MENKPPKEYLNNNYDSKSFSSNNHKKIPHPKSKNLKYYPITTNNSYQGEHIIYLAAEDDEKNKLIKNIKKKSIKKRNKTNKFLSFQRSIEMEFPKNQSQQINNSDKKEKFISTSKNSCDNENFNSKHQIKRSYSVENYSNVTNKSFDILGLNLKLLENSKIMDTNFINGIKDSKRKNNLLNALNKYNRYKSLGNINEKNNKIILNEEKNENNLPKIEKKFDMKNGCNIIEEDENENSENDTINIKKNNNDYINKKNTNSKEKDIKNNSINININDNLKLDNSNKEKNCQPINNQISKKIKISNPNINNNKIKKALKPINNNKVISKEINKTSNEKEVIIVDDGSDVGAGLSGSGW
jgi:DnaJ family protein A protein 5